MAQAAGADWVVVDGYHFSATYRQQLQQTGRRILTVDDLATDNLVPSDVVLNSNSYATHELYSGLVGGAALLLGTQYALLRREFRPWRFWTPIGLCFMSSVLRHGPICQIYRLSQINQQKTDCSETKTYQFHLIN
jgi:hypothetical protein